MDENACWRERDVGFREHIQALTLCLSDFAIEISDRLVMMNDVSFVN